MNAGKNRGRPPKDHKRTHQYNVRLTDDEFEILEYLYTRSNKSRAELFREALKILYDWRRNSEI